MEGSKQETFSEPQHRSANVIVRVEWSDQRGGEPLACVLDEPDAGRDRLGGECTEALHGGFADLERMGHWAAISHQLSDQR